MVTTSPLTPGFSYDELTGRYRAIPSGRFVPASAIHNALQDTIANATNTAAKLADSLRSGQLSVAEWQLQMSAAIKDTHLASAALAKGGWAQMTPSDFGRVGQIVRSNYGYLNKFAAAIADGTQLLDGTFTNRCKLYVKDGKTTYQVVRERELMRAGYDEESNILGPGEINHCPGCEEATARGWVPIGTLPKIGTRDCWQNCTCSVTYRKSAA